MQEMQAPVLEGKKLVFASILRAGNGLLEGMLELVPSHVKSVLDVGCSEGLFGKAVKDKTGAEVWGIEPVADAASKAEKVLDKAFTGFFEDAVKNIDRKFDLVCFNDVLEHMPDPYSALAYTKKLLSENGQVNASMPNLLHYHEFFEILTKKDFVYTDKGIMDRTHLRWFTRKSMIRMFEEAGFTVTKVVGLDPTPSMKMNLISILSFGYLSEMKYPQFAITAVVKK